MLCTNLSPRDINQINRRHHELRRIAFYERMANPAIYETASEAWKGQQCRAVPLANQLSWEMALEDVERAGQRFSKQRAAKGGTARKTDALQFLIEELVERDPKISKNHLLEKLRGFQQTRAIVQDIDENTISFAVDGYNIKEAPISGIKDRLSRARKKHQSR